MSVPMSMFLSLIDAAAGEAGRVPVAELDPYVEAAFEQDSREYEAEYEEVGFTDFDDEAWEATHGGTE